jgi:SAM-dependent methyltransferase
MNNIEQNRSKCWCGGNLKNSVHPLYNQCIECETFSLKNIFVEEYLQKFYGFNEYWHKYQTEVSRHPAIEVRAKNDFRDRVPVWYNTLKRYKENIDSILEIGCAPGSFLKYCQDKGIKDISGIEVDSLTCKFIEENFNFPEGSIIPGLFPDVKLPRRKFDAICAFDLVEHLQSPIAAMKKIKSLLKKDGVFFFQAPCYRGEGEDWQAFRPDEHVYIYNEKNFQMLLDRAGLKTITIFDGYFAYDMFIVGGIK